MHSDVDKDEFCKLWVKMNTQRVKAAKVLAAQRERERKQREQLWNIVMTFGGMSYEVMQSQASEQLTKRQQQLLRTVGIQTERDEWNCKLLSTVLYEIKKYLKAA